jgi:hypothetical protein
MTERAWMAAAATLLAAVATVSLARATAPDPDPLRSYVTSISAQLDPRVARTLAQLDGTGQQLLALRSYLRSTPHLAGRWSWTQAQIEAFEGSPEQRDLQQEIDRVRTTFVAANPGFELYVNSQVRSLDVQVEHWNSNESVTAAAAEILTTAQAIDFQVHQGGRVVAGPQASPPAPWHYTYVPEARDRPLARGRSIRCSQT